MTDSQIASMLTKCLALATLLVLLAGILVGAAYPLVREVIGCSSIGLLCGAFVGAWYVWDVSHPVGQSR